MQQLGCQKQVGDINKQTNKQKNPGLSNIENKLVVTRGEADGGMSDINDDEEKYTEHQECRELLNHYWTIETNTTPHVNYTATLHVQFFFLNGWEMQRVPKN